MATLGIFGANGRVGKMLIEQACDFDELDLGVAFAKTQFGSNTDNLLVTNSIDEFVKRSDIIIDFSSPEGTLSLLEKALEYAPKRLVIGTTGLNEHTQNLIKEAGKSMSVFYASNMSLGVAVLQKIVYEASKALKDFDIEIVEMHHKYKKDAPSGTALSLAQIAAKARDLNIDDVRISGRNGMIGERKKDEISVMSLRGGDIVGEHTVGFYAQGEFLRLSHTATDRKTFAIGALKAAQWLLKQENGLYSINDFLF